MAAAYLADRLASIGVEALPVTGGRDGGRDSVPSPYLHPVSFLAYAPDTSRARLRIQTVAGTRTLRPPDFYTPGGAPSAHADFAGDVLVAGPTPDALASLGDTDVEGRVVVLAPPWTGLEDVERELVARGAAGAIEGVPNAFYDRLRVVRGPVRFALADEPAEAGRGLPAVVVGPAGIEALGLDAAFDPDGFGAADAGPADPGVRVSVTTGLTPEPRAGRNVVGWIPGSDPGSRDAYVVLMAHFDHVGSGDPSGDDAIWNGFVDNAAGVAILLEVARNLAADPPPLSTIVLFTTGEEQGLLGARAFVREPPVPLERVRVAINVDGGAPPADNAAWTIAAAAGSEIGERARDALVGSDQAVEIRPLNADSDHWAFHRAGVPALFLYPAEQAADTHPHTPGDEWRPDFPFEGLARYADVTLTVARALAMMPATRSAR